MNRSLRIFARRIVLVHAALLLAVLATVAGASHAVYRSAHEQAITQSRKQLDLLANQTGSGLRGYYDAIFSDLNLFKPVDPDAEDTEDRSLEAQAPQLLPPPPPQGSGQGRGRARGAQIQLPPGVRTLSGALPYQLSGRVAHLFMFLRDGSLNPRTFVRKHLLEDDPLDEPHRNGTPMNGTHTNGAHSAGQAPLKENERPPYDADAT